LYFYVYRVQTRKTKNQVSIGPILVSGLDSFNITDTSSWEIREHYKRYHEIYHMFQNEEYPSDDEDIDEYKNIGRSNIHTVDCSP
jgi:hypothetical protein